MACISKSTWPAISGDNTDKAALPPSTKPVGLAINKSSKQGLKGFLPKRYNF